MAPTLFVSIVVPVRNESKFICDTINALLRQDYPNDRFEILVVDGGSDDNTCELVQAICDDHPNVRLLHNPKRWSSAARNIGVTESVGDVVTIVDGHCDVHSDQYLQNLVDAFNESDADIVGRHQLLNVQNA